MKPPMAHPHTIASPDSTAFTRDGYLIPDRRLPDALLHNMQASLQRLITENPQVRPEHLVLRWGGGDHALPTHQKFLEYVSAPEILDVVERVLGPDIIC